MFAITTTASLRTLAVAAVALAAASPATAAGPEASIPVTIQLDEVRALPGPLYVSIQTREDYMSETGEGGIVAEVTPGLTDVTYLIREPGDYAVSLWHDLDSDGEFSMTERYEIIDGWGASGTVKRTARPTFDDVKVVVPGYGANVTPTMFYPEG